MYSRKVLNTLVPLKTFGRLFWIGFLKMILSITPFKKLKITTMETISAKKVNATELEQKSKKNVSGCRNESRR
jgi:hypothetical protein